MLDPDGKVIDWGASAGRMIGYAAEEIIGRNYSCFFDTGDIARGRPAVVLRNVVLTEQHEEIGTSIRKDGSGFPSCRTFKALRDEAGTLCGILEVCRDLTERANSEARYKGLLEAAPDAMVVVNEASEIVLLNGQAEKQFDYSRDELVGKNVKSIIPDGFAERLVADSQRTSMEALAQQIGTGIELHGRRKDGTVFPIEIMLSALETVEGIFVTAAIRDISERKQLARQLHQSQKMETVGQLTGGIAHDFNNLLGVILGNLYLLDLLVAGNEAAIKRVRTAQKAATRGVEITRRLLVFSNNEELKPAFVTLGDSVRNMIEMASRGLGLDIRITTKLESSLPLVFVEPSALESALLNLVVNARDAMPKGGSIMISSMLQTLGPTDPEVRNGTLLAGHYACVQVTDTGQGMSPQTLDRAFEPFFTTKHSNKGTGLGLAMVHGFAKQSGGIVRISSTIGRGTTVSIYMPVVKDAPFQNPVAVRELQGPILYGTVLIVDNEPDLLEVAHAYLKELGLQPLEAKDGESALAMLKLHSEIDLMITDIAMDYEMSGIQLVETALALRPDLKVIYSSGLSDEALSAKSSALGSVRLLRKPYMQAEFTESVRQVMKVNGTEPTCTGQAPTRP